MTEQQSGKPPDASWNPVIMSVVVYPGIGQWMQQRHTAGTVYLAFFTLVAAMFAWTFIVYLREVVATVNAVMEGTAPEGAALPPLAAILKPFAVVLFIYLANVIDVLRGRYQLRREQEPTQP